MILPQEMLDGFLESRNEECRANGDLLNPYNLVFLEGTYFYQESVVTGGNFPRLNNSLCFENSVSWCLRTSSFRYVEGYALNCVGVFRHSWCITEENQVFETTWLKEFDAYIYKGVVFSPELLAVCVRKFEYVGFLDNSELENNPLLEPGLSEEVRTQRILSA